MGSGMATFGLSKTKIISGLQCVKRLYLQVHQPDEAVTEESAERLIAFGYRVQEVARGAVSRWQAGWP